MSDFSVVLSGMSTFRRCALRSSAKLCTRKQIARKQKFWWRGNCCTAMCIKSWLHTDSTFENALELHNGMEKLWIGSMKSSRITNFQTKIIVNHLSDIIRQSIWRPEERRYAKDKCSYDEPTGTVKQSNKGEGRRAAENAPRSLWVRMLRRRKIAQHPIRSHSHLPLYL